MAMKPCPKCQHPKSEIQEYDGDCWRVCCHCRMATGPCLTKAAANKEWNDRTPSPKAK